MDYKSYFPYFKYNPDEIYFESAATSLKLEQVIKAEAEYNEKIAANTHNDLFDNAYKANVILDTTRKMTAKFIGAKNHNEVIFTSGATHSLNQICFGLKTYLKKDDEVVLTILEHSSNLLPWKVLEEEIGIKIKYLDLNDNGSIDPNKIDNTINKKTKIVSFASVSNTVGASNDVQSIANAIKNINNDIIIVVDIAQSVLHTRTNVEEWNVDFVAFSSHKMFGPFGLGILWGKKEKLDILKPLIYGGGNNVNITLTEYKLAQIPQKFEAGTLNLSAVYGFLEALKFIDKISIEKIQEYEEGLKRYLVDELSKIDVSKFEFYNLKNPQPIVLFNMIGVSSQDFGAFLNKKYKISVRVGKHCARLSHLKTGALTTIRASFSIYNTRNDIDIFIKALLDCENWVNELI